ncbi:histidine phosphatase family protein [Flexivirga sp. ID2601S]|uniref:Histidine phosphatase family protein n=1 Tax=Flexivirga aerilata TaxID=1656889 RepID=A0A849AKL4_9MICO|nr:histidine phosphatase family protein [Flexivirga aerilata]NNG40909.1 histidine phosphatase family protein [Flexivirga aerilata]
MSLHCPATVILARHGEAVYEATTWADEGGSLTSVGRKQAAGLASALQDRRVAHVYCSTMARAVQTAELAAAMLDVDVTTRLGLQEFAVGDFAGVDRAAEDPFAPTFRTWLDGDLSARIRGAESGAEVVARGRTVLEEIADRHPGETVLVVAHGGILTLLVRHLLTVENGVTPRGFVNCGYAETALGADGWRLTGWSAA